ncbi:hypothetical protein [Clostridium sp. Marseille-P2415]|uniref:hypothetical protein n=1 Tax=Clostridium sp. Marseille-P2415 TaxID=1805471 RepID=UPI00098891D0|nr:hypothetical protein [Clostridium sp. Marseille-P2415]
MKEKGFFQTKAGGLTIAFIAIIVAFITIMIGLYSASKVLCLVGFAIVVAAMLYSPCKVYIYDCMKNDKRK